MRRLWHFILFQRWQSILSQHFLHSIFQPMVLHDNIPSNFFFLKIKWTFFEKWKILCSPQNSLFIFFKTFLIRLYVFPHLVSLGILRRIYTIAIHRKLHFTVDIIYRIFFICFHLYNQRRLLQIWDPESKNDIHFLFLRKRNKKFLS